MNKNMWKRISALSLTAMTLFATVGCGGGGGGTSSGGATSGGGTSSSTNPDAIKFVIGNVDAGLGDEWLNAIATEFEKEYADWEGKGVDVTIDNKSTEFATPQLVINMPSNPHDVYVLANSSYMTLKNANVLADVTDVLTAKNYDEKGDLLEEGNTVAEDKKTSIASRMVSFYEEYYNLGTETEPSYFGMPFFSTPSGAIYDADYFNDKRLYMTKNGQFGATQADVDAGNAGVGPDGKSGTYDDGLPETYEQFKQLCATIKTRGGIPFIFDTQHEYQRNYALNQVWANYEGANDYMLNYSLSGHDNDMNIDINDKNGYELLKQPGRLAMYTYAKDIVSSGWYDSEAYTANVSHTGAQMKYLFSAERGKRTAFLFEGSWWENESRDSFALMEEYYNNPDYGFGKRNFKLLPMPRFVGTEGIKDQQNTRQVLTCTSAGNSMICVNANSKKMELAKEFIKFIHSRKMLALMSQTSSVLRPYEYEMTDEELKGATTFFNSIYTMWKDESVDVVYDVTTSKKITGNPSYFGNFHIYNEPFTKFIGNGGLTALAHYNAQTALYKSTDAVWAQ